MIELDVSHPLERVEPRRRPIPARRWLRPAALALALLAALSLGGAATADRWPNRPVRIAMDRGTGFLLGGDSLYVVATSGATARITAYRLADGRRAWTAVEPAVEPPELSERARVLFVSPDGISTIAYDARTGARRWEHPGRLVGVSDLAVLGSNLGPTVTSPEGWLYGVDLGTGRRRWSRPLAVPARARLDDDGSVGVVPTGAQPAYRLDPATGTTLPGTFDARRALTEHSARMVLSVTTAGGRSTVTARRTDGAAPQWTKTVAGQSDGDNGDCGPWVCLYLRSSTIAFDPDTGREVWQVPWVRVSNDGGPGRYLLGWRPGTGGGPGEIGLIDPVSGATTRTLPDWRQVGIHVTDTAAIVRDTGLRTTEVAAVNLVTGEVVRLGETDNVSGDCTATTTHVACPHRGRELRVWPLRP